MKWEDPEVVAERELKRPPTGTVAMEYLYPPREGYTFIHRDKMGSVLHTGYESEKTRRCVCHTRPVFEQYIDDYDENGIRNVPAKEFVAICPKCEIKMRGHGDLEFCRKQWNAGKFSRDSVMVRYRPKDPDPAGIEALSRKAVAGAVEDAVDAVKHRHLLMKQLNRKGASDGEREIAYTHLKTIMANLRKLQKFFETSPLMMDFDDEAILSSVRMQVYPELTPDERVKIPLNLLKM